MLTALRPLIHIIAAERTSTRPDLFDDAVQEALIASWTTSTSHPDASRAYVTAAARNAVTGVLQGRPYTGAPSRRGWQDAGDSAVTLTPVYDGEETVTADLTDPTTEPAFDAALSRVHAHEVRAAVAALSEDDAVLVALRFGRDLTWPEVAAAVGRRTEAVRRRFVDHIAPALRSELAHLSTA